jgi:beta-glucan synthesis-associated protein KRE6
MPLSIQTVEPDDYLHNPDPSRDRDRDRGGHICTARGIANLGCLFLLGGGIMMLLYVYFPFCEI